MKIIFNYNYLMFNATFIAHIFFNYSNCIHTIHAYVCIYYTSYLDVTS